MIDSEPQPITTDRQETKYLVPADRMDGLIRQIDEQLPAYRFTGEGANRLPDAHHFVTTIYFDTPTRKHFKTGSHERHAKLRAKEYYDLHPSLAELATDPRQIVRYQPWLWFELKRRDGRRTFKRRFRLAKHHVPGFFSGARHTLDFEKLKHEDGDVDTLQEIVEYCRALAEPLTADCLVNYRRLSWQTPCAGLRVTLDLGLSFYAPPSDLWSRDFALLRNTLGAACGRVKQAVLEVKHLSGCPDWLKVALADAGVRAQNFSKFVAASEVVHGRAATRRMLAASS